MNNEEVTVPDSGGRVQLGDAYQMNMVVDLVDPPLLEPRDEHRMPQNINIALLEALLERARPGSSVVL